MIKRAIHNWRYDRLTSKIREVENQMAALLTQCDLKHSVLLDEHRALQEDYQRFRAMSFDRLPYLAVIKDHTLGRLSQAMKDNRLREDDVLREADDMAKALKDRDSKLRAARMALPMR